MSNTRRRHSGTQTNCLPVQVIRKGVGVPPVSVDTGSPGPPEGRGKKKKINYLLSVYCTTILLL